MQPTIARPTSYRRHGLPWTGGSSPRRPRTPVAPAPVRRPLPCRAGNPELWFADSPDQLEVAKRLCGGCPLRDACLAGALDRAEPWGVWGGEIFERGVVIARKRPRGRPRKVVAA
ncbi:WhiB family transcriptional regulator [Blastococcus sp. CT_GayMR19]|uniref:WhiB family transcriptional regulator n=1 Tax=Blastococcus sp. CT_GayMR19 TaxID=2559608 RepID=UPI001FD78D45|nr:WhiB family transcriptional regulator [Blastococcus sp. CT_GayMR19]